MTFSAILLFSGDFFFFFCAKSYLIMAQNLVYQGVSRFRQPIGIFQKLSLGGKWCLVTSYFPLIPS
jgi:hypothetical protein